MSDNILPTSFDKFFNIISNLFCHSHENGNPVFLNSCTLSGFPLSQEWQEGGVKLLRRMQYAPTSFIISSFLSCGHDASCPYLWILIFFTRYTILDTIFFWILTPSFLTVRYSFFSIYYTLHTNYTIHYINW